MYYQNVRSIRSKIGDFKNNLTGSVNVYRIIVLVETWLGASVDDKEFGVSGYFTYRADRDCKLSGKSRGGGVAILVSNNFRSSVVLQVREGFELLIVRIFSGSSSFYVGAVYIAPFSSHKADDFLINYNSLISHINNFLIKISSSKLLLVGDFNLPGFKWENSADTCLARGFNSNSLIQESLRNLESTINFYALRQIVNTCNPSGNFLDLAFTNIDSIFSSLIIDPLLPEDPHHPPLEFICNFTFEAVTASHDLSFNFFKADYDVLNTSLSCIDWDYLGGFHDIDMALQFFYDKVTECISCHVPLSRTCPHSYPVWFTREIIDAIKLKKKLHMLYKTFNHHNDYLLFKSQRAYCMQIISLAFGEYIKSIEENIIHDSKSFWKLVNSGSGVLPTIMLYNDSELITPLEVANGFAAYFSSNFSSNNNTTSHNSTVFSNDSLSYIYFSSDSILSKLSNLCITSAAGPDGLHPVFLRNCSVSLCKPVYFIFNLILKSGVFPGFWKLTSVTPIYKKNDRNNVKNYRPIAKVSHIAKIFDSLLNEVLFSYFKTYFSDCQHGFLPNRSSSSNLAVFTSYLAESISLGRQVDVVYTDMKSAFDSLDHSYIIFKLKAYGITDPLLSVISSFLNSRPHYVKIRNVVSDQYIASSGVPQGSHCGPLFFNICFIDLPSVVRSSSILLYADDFKIYREIVDDVDAHLLQCDLNAVSDWCIQSGLKFNIDKCSLITFYKSKFINFSYNLVGGNINRVELIKDLGVYLDSHLTFSHHIDYIIAKASRALGFLYRNSLKFSNHNSFIVLYMAYVRCIFCYCSVIWKPLHKMHIRRIESVQHRFLRLLSYKIGEPMDRFCHDYSQLAERFNICTISSLHDYFDALFFFKVTRGFIDSPPLLNHIDFHVPARHLRHTGIIASVRLMRSDLNHRHVLNRCGVVVNCLGGNVDLFNDSTGSFKKSCKELLLKFL